MVHCAALPVLLPTLIRILRRCSTVPYTAQQKRFLAVSPFISTAHHKGSVCSAAAGGVASALSQLTASAYTHQRLRQGRTKHSVLRSVLTGEAAEPTALPVLAAHALVALLHIGGIDLDRVLEGAHIPAHRLLQVLQDQLAMLSCTATL